MELPNPDPVTGRPVHGGEDRHICVSVKNPMRLKSVLENAGKWCGGSPTCCCSFIYIYWCLLIYMFCWEQGYHIQWASQEGQSYSHVILMVTHWNVNHHTCMMLWRSKIFYSSWKHLSGGTDQAGWLCFQMLLELYHYPSYQETLDWVSAPIKLVIAHTLAWSDLGSLIKWTWWVYSRYL